MKKDATKAAKTATDNASNAVQIEITTAEAKKLAKSYLKCLSAAKKLEAEKKETEAKLRLYVELTGTRIIGDLVAYDKKMPAKLVGAEDSLKEQLEVQLMNSLPAYRVVKLDVTSMAKNLQHDLNIIPALEATGLKLIQETHVYFKHV